MSLVESGITLKTGSSDPGLGLMEALSRVIMCKVQSKCVCELGMGRFTDIKVHDATVPIKKLCTGCNLKCN